MIVSSECSRTRVTLGTGASGPSRQTNSCARARSSKDPMMKPKLVPSFEQQLFTYVGEVHYLINREHSSHDTVFTVG